MTMTLIERLRAWDRLWCGAEPGGAALMGEAADEIERLRAALEVCAADFISPACTMSDAYQLVAAEFRRRMRTAAEALGRTI